MSQDKGVPVTGDHEVTRKRLEELKRVTSAGVEYWLAREISQALGYTWQGFEGVMERAKAAASGVGVAPENHFRLTSRMVEVGSGARRDVADYFLSRAACYLVAMNGDPNKAEVAAAQAYFAVQTRRMELRDQADAAASEDARRLELRARVTAAVKKVSGVAQQAGVANQKQPIFHDARYHGLYGMGMRAVKQRKGVGEKEQLLDRVGALELSAHDFQMNLAAEVIIKERIQGEQRAIETNRSVGQRVRRVIEESGSPLPEDLPLAPPIKEVEKRVKSQKKLAKPE
jgi:DNA-damage-inducible protein D